jgi:DNA helicase-2/ATP-dependent DNA helicase PcrA
LADPIVSEELKLLERVRETLARGPALEPPSEASIIEELERIREQLLRGVLDDYERSSLNTRWHVQSAVLAQIRTSRQAPRVDPRSPYFGHIRLREGNRERDLCLGKATFLDHGLRIVDWRHAPIARLYYRYRQGEEYEEEISGRTIVGEVTARRTVSIRDGELERVDAPEGSFVAEPTGWRRVDLESRRLAGGEGAALRVHRGDEVAGRRLGTDLLGVRQRADKRLPDIAGLIDPEQFALITRPQSGFAAIRGAAGSGKTTVALHRIAYLAYEDPSVDSTATLFVVFSPALRQYVSHVLPALGVERVQVRTFQDWAAGQRRRLLPRLPNRVREDAPAEVQRLKLHPALFAALTRHVEELEGKPIPEQVIDDWMSVLSNRALLERVLGERDEGGLTPRELERATSWCREQNRTLRAWIDGDTSVPAELDPEDDAILLRAWQLRVGPLPGPDQRPLRYRHVAIDEVQDFAPSEVRVLLECLDQRQSLTLAGDTQQHLLEHSGFTSWSSFFSELGIPGTEVQTLQVSYRSSREITEFALAVLGDLRDAETPVVTTRSGPAVELFEFTDSGACVAFLADALRELVSQEPLASVAVLAPSSEASELYHAGLDRSDVPRLRLVQEQDFSFAPGIEVTEIDKVKGLEFDYVIVVDVDEASFPSDAIGRRRLHVAATRAIHQLWLTSVKRPAEIARSAAAASRS